MRAALNIIRKNRKVQGLLLVLVALVIADAGFYSLRTVPEEAKVAGLEERSSKLREDIRKKETEYRVYYTFDKGRSDIAEFKKQLPARTDYIKLIRRVIKIAKEDGMKSDEFSSETREVLHEGDLEQLSFSMPITGSYMDARKFIHDVEGSDLFLNIDDMSISSSETTDDISLAIDLTTYVRS